MGIQRIEVVSEHSAVTVGVLVRNRGFTRRTVDAQVVQVAHG